MHIRQDALERSVRQLRRSQADAAVSLEQALTHLTDSVTSIFGLTGAGLMLVNDEQLLEAALATDELGWTLEDAETQTGEGPCVDTVVHGRIVHTDDVRSDDRWPRLREWDESDRSALAAFNHLRGIARPSQRKVHDVAREMLAEHE